MNCVDISKKKGELLRMYNRVNENGKKTRTIVRLSGAGAAIKAARNEYGESRKKVSDELYISPRYLANIENKGQQPSLQVFYYLVTRYHIR